MKRTFYATVAIIMAAVMVASCKKDAVTNNPNPPGQNPSFVRIQQGVSADDDTVYLLKYNDKGKLLSIVDSINQDTLTATYNSSNQIGSIADHSYWGEDALSVTYNSNGTIQTIDYTIAGEKDRYSFEYGTGGSIPTVSRFYTDAGQNGILVLWRMYMYTAPGGDITGISEYDKNGQPLGLRTLTYGSQSNTFKDIALFNWANRLGFDNIAFIEMIFNQHLPAKVIWYSGSNVAYTTTLTPTNNSQGKPAGIVAQQVYPDNSALNFTWTFGY